MNGIVACETLYPELPGTDPEAAIEYVPQWYHEYPIHTPESTRAHELLQDAIDALEAQGVDHVVVIYHDGEALEGLQTQSVPLSVYRGRDCIELHLDGTPTGPGNERKAGATYYLTRGWIDVAVDSYKVYRAYAGELQDLVAAFEKAKGDTPGMRVSWPESEKIQQAAERSDTMRTDPAAILRTVLDSFRHVVLIDSGRLTPFHRRYAEWVQSFFAEAIPETGVRDVSLQEIPGSTAELESIVSAPETGPDVETLDPGTPVPPEPGFRSGPQHS